MRVLYVPEMVPLRACLFVNAGSGRDACFSSMGTYMLFKLRNKRSLGVSGARLRTGMATQGIRLLTLSKEPLPVATLVMTVSGGT